MTEKSRKSIVNKIIKNRKYDDRIKEQYHAYWKKYSIRLSIVAVTYFIFYAILHAVCRPKIFSGWLFGFIFISKCIRFFDWCRIRRKWGSAMITKFPTCFFVTIWTYHETNSLFLNR